MAFSSGDFTIIGVQSGNYNFQGNNGRGITVLPSAATDRYIISNNRLYGNVTGGLFDGGGEATKYIAGNI